MMVFIFQISLACGCGFGSRSFFGSFYGGEHISAAPMMAVLKLVV